MSMDLVGRAAALYALPLDGFVAARNLAAKEAAQGGDKDLAATLRKLPKPSSAAWLVNLLVSRRREEVEQVLELAASLREAQSSPDRAQLHALGQQRQRLLAAVARQSLDAASEAGHDVGPAALPDVEQTLRAALADPAAAEAVLTGRLVRTLEATGWEAVDLDGAVGGPFDAPARPVDDADDANDTDDADNTDDTDDSTDSRGRGGAEDARRPGRASPQKRSAAGRRVAEATARAARDALESAQDEAARTERAVQRIAMRRDGLTATLEDLEDRIGALRRELADLDEEAADRRREQESAQEALEGAEQAVRAARSSLADLDP
ncbi:hypothetical protein [Arthrobacter sp. N1]|uniref:hypothetical protein n=1 Tax=Arthrobacter sp. N1 TaxID=619291 RepID=UPI003BAF2AB2